MQGVIKFFKQLKDAMGKNVKLITESITEGEGYSATVTWHLGKDCTSHNLASYQKKLTLVEGSSPSSLSGSYTGQAWM